MDVRLASLTTLGAVAGGSGAVGVYKLVNREDSSNSLTSEEYQLVFRKFKSEGDFIAALKTRVPNITSQSTYEEGGKAAKEWCERNDSSNSKRWCLQLPKTIGEELGKPLATNWEKQIKDIKAKNIDGLLDDLKTVNSKLPSVDENKDSQEALRGWCKSKLDIKLISDGADSILEKVKSRCLSNDN
ncbi:hypothetical protein HF1_01810 [Mycoplasma haemofelis str. Langford 1]|uniref:Uncharacterized protein n=2 Tax=Mycoplasma haemofelis TaxID=29501 RepID=F6FGB8_MYCHI|nr:hypothetical protein [Mycoplasma haemofelis]AEG72508.1 hypothetical protein MHF_0209 [Mycoplasma haemofelis Ohio2]CBY92189.1 hypothetical protein HF1_01810 [Mycoplasma haemofelis str. Langford 1]